MVSSVVSRSGGEAVHGAIQPSDSVADLQEAIHAKSTPPPSISSDKCTDYKSRLQQWAQRKKLKLPVYQTESNGDRPHQREFRSIVEVGGERFVSHQWHGRRKDAEQDAAKGAYEILVTIDDDDDPTDVLGLIEKDVVFCKSILSEFAVKTKATQPTYSLGRPEGLAAMTLFVSSVLFAGNTYTGEAATNKKDAERKAARDAVKSILATNNNCMKEIIRSKKQLIIAITSAGFNKERAVAACPTVDQGANIIPAASPSAQAISRSKKRKKNRTTSQSVTHRSIRWRKVLSPMLVEVNGLQMPCNDHQ